MSPTTEFRAVLARPVRALVVALLVIGSMLALLFAHSAEAGHGPTHSEAAVSAAAADHGQADAAAAPAAPAVPIGETLALCLSIGLGCVIAVFVLLLAARAVPVPGGLAARPPGRQRATIVVPFASAPALDALCVSRT